LRFEDIWRWNIGHMKSENTEVKSEDKNGK
jgi:hypothetical protein